MMNMTTGRSIPQRAGKVLRTSPRRGRPDADSPQGPLLGALTQTIRHVLLECGCELPLRELITEFKPSFTAAWIRVAVNAMAARDEVQLRPGTMDGEVLVEIVELRPGEAERYGILNEAGHAP